MTPSSRQFPSSKSFVSLFIFILCPTSFQSFLSGSDGKESSHDVGDLGSIPGSGRFPGEGNGHPLSILAWEIPWTEEHSGLQSMGMQRVIHDWVTNTHHTSFWETGLPFWASGSSTSIQKLFCGSCSAHRLSFDAFVVEKEVSPSYFSTILVPLP